MSEEMINSTNQQNAPEDNPSWEAQLQARANEFINQRIGSLKAEVDRLQSTVTEISAKLAEQAQPVATPEETSGLLDYVKQWFSDSSAKAEQEYERRLNEARGEWETAARQAGEEEFHKRLEQACTEAAAVARREADTQIEELREQLEASRKALTLAVSSAQTSASQASSFEQLKTAIEDIDSQRTQSDTLAVLVRRAAQFAPRVVFFVVKGGDAVGWKASGFDNGLNDETVRLLSVPTQNQTLLREALTTFGVAIGRSASPGENSAVLGLYGSPAPETALAIPLVVRGKAAAVLYADSGTQSESAINAAALESLMRVASMGIELLPARRGIEPTRPAGPPAQLNASTASLASAAAPAVAPAVEPEKPAEAAEPAKPEPAAEEQASAPVAQTAEQTPEPKTGEAVAAAAQAAVKPSEAPDRITEELRPSADLADQQAAVALHSAPTTPDIETESVNEVPTAEIPVVAPPSPVSEPLKFEPVVPPPPPAPPVFAASQVQSELASPKFESPQFEAPVAPPAFTAPIAEPPRQAQPVMSMPAPASETEQRAHNDARRFARLLVSEIKLYNAAKVNEGRRGFDLYERLRDEIDRSRKVYDKRVSPAVATRFDYFYDELVQTLAEGDATKLGPNCPGPVVLGS